MIPIPHKKQDFAYSTPLTIDDEMSLEEIKKGISKIIDKYDLFYSPKHFNEIYIADEWVKWVEAMETDFKFAKKCLEANYFFTVEDEVKVHYLTKDEMVEIPKVKKWKTL